MELISLSLLSNSHFRCDVWWLIVDDAGRLLLLLVICFAYLRFTSRLCAVDEPVYCILRWSRFGWRTLMLFIRRRLSLSMAQMSWKCHETRFSSTLASPFFSFVNQKLKSNIAESLPASCFPFVIRIFRFRSSSLRGPMEREWAWNIIALSLLRLLSYVPIVASLFRSRELQRNGKRRKEIRVESNTKQKERKIHKATKQ